VIAHRVSNEAGQLSLGATALLNILVIGKALCIDSRSGFRLDRDPVTTVHLVPSSQSQTQLTSERAILNIVSKVFPSG